VPDDTLDNEITAEVVTICKAVVVLELETHDETVAETELLRDFNTLEDDTGLLDSIDAEDDEVVLREAIDERDNKGDSVDDKEATVEVLP